MNRILVENTILNFITTSMNRFDQSNSQLTADVFHNPIKIDSGAAEVLGDLFGTAVAAVVMHEKDKKGPPDHTSGTAPISTSRSKYLRADAVQYLVNDSSSVI